MERTVRRVKGDHGTTRFLCLERINSERCIRDNIYRGVVSGGGANIAGTRIAHCPVEVLRQYSPQSSYVYIPAIFRRTEGHCGVQAPLAEQAERADCGQNIRQRCHQVRIKLRIADWAANADLSRMSAVVDGRMAGSAPAYNHWCPVKYFATICEYRHFNRMA